ncbi:MAG: hypothetical protein COX19_12390, partial [Desulfobacterales bacterium CG23_combo_of_CG06-09_8_20_14_all_51_8]
KEALQKYLFQKGVKEKRTVVLIIDEAQKLNSFSLEMLRVLLNYETNEFKLFQLILLGQLELYAKIINMSNFLDRVSFKYTLNPLDEEETMSLIEFRLRQAGYKSNMKLFSYGSVKQIHRYTGGSPRKIAMLCHKALKYLVMRNKFVADENLIHEIVNEEVKQGWFTAGQTSLLQKSSF